MTILHKYHTLGFVLPFGGNGRYKSFYIAKMGIIIIESFYSKWLINNVIKTEKMCIRNVILSAQSLNKNILTHI